MSNQDMQFTTAGRRLQCVNKRVEGAFSHALKPGRPVSVDAEGDRFELSRFG